MKKVDMSSEAITRRLRLASELRDLSLSLMKAKKDYDEKVKLAREQPEKSHPNADPQENTA